MTNVRDLARAVVVAAMALLVPSTLVSANVATYTRTTGPTADNWATTFTIPKFDPALGTLNQVVIGLTGGNSGSVSVYNNYGPNSNGASCYVNFTDTILLSRPDTTTLVTFSPLETTAYQYVWGWYFGTFDNLSATGSGGYSSAPASSDLALFTGTDNITLPISSTQHVSVGGDDAWRFSFAPMPPDISSDATLTVQYDYTVPEPATLSLLALGGLLAMRRRRSR